MSQNLFDFSENKDEKKAFFFTVLNFPDEYIIYSTKKELPDLKIFVRIEEEEKAIDYMKIHGIDPYTAGNYLNKARTNERQNIAFLRYEELPIF